MKIFDLPLFALEAQQVIWLRSLKLAAGGSQANIESFAMIVEKVGAAQEAAVSIALGKSIDSVLRRYRSKVRANLRRLSRDAGPRPAGRSRTQ